MEVKSQGVAARRANDASRSHHHNAAPAGTTQPAPSWPGIALRRLSSICSLCPSSPGPLPHPPRCPHLVDDARARLPEADAILGAGGGQEVVHLLVHLRAGRKAGKSGGVRVAAQRVKRGRPHGVGTPARQQAQHRWNNGNSRPATSRRSISRTLLARSRSALPPNELSLRAEGWGGDEGHTQTEVQARMAAGRSCVIRLSHPSHGHSMPARLWLWPPLGPHRSAWGAVVPSIR